MIVGAGATKMAFSVFARAVVTRNVKDEVMKARKSMVAELDEVD